MNFTNYDIEMTQNQCLNHWSCHQSHQTGYCWLGVRGGGLSLGRGVGLSLRGGGELSLGKFLQFIHLQPGIQQLPDFLHLHLLLVQPVLQVHPRSNSRTFSCMCLMFSSESQSISSCPLVSFHPYFCTGRSTISLFVACRQ